MCDGKPKTCYSLTTTSGLLDHPEARKLSFLFDEMATQKQNLM